MATADAIAELGDTLVQVLETGLAGLVAAGQVTLSTPDELKTFKAGQPAVTIFLYHVGVASELRNGARRSAPNGGLHRPPLPIEARFMITPWAAQTRDAYRVAGAIAQVLYDHAVIPFGELVGSSWSPDDTVELILESLPVEEHFDIWDPAEIPYRLSLTYLARIIGIDSLLTTQVPPVVQATFPRAAP